MPGKLWTQFEIRQMRSYARQGIPSSEAAFYIGRSAGSLRFKAAKMRIRFTSLGKSHSRKQKARYSKGK